MNWEKKKLTQLAEYINGYAFKPDDLKKTGVPIIRIEQLKNPRGRFDYYDGTIPERNHINKGDLIFSWSASLFLKIWQDDFSYLNQHLFKVIEFDNIDRLFLKYLLDFSIPELSKMAHGSTMKHVTRKELNQFWVSVPEDKIVQKKIATILSTIDQAIEKTKALIVKNKRIKTGLMQDLLTKGIDEHGNIRSEETHEFKDSPLGRIPKEWNDTPLKNLLKYISYGFTNPMPTTEEGVYMVTAANINNGRILYKKCRKTSRHEYEKTLTKKSKPDIGDILITKDGSLGRLAIVDRKDVCINQSVAILKNKENLVSNQFLKMLLESPKYQDIIIAESGGSTIKHIYITKLAKMMVAIPKTTHEQEAILNILGCYNNQLTNLKSDLQKLQRIKTGLMQDLLTGKVSVDALLEEKKAITL